MAAQSNVVKVPPPGEVLAIGSKESIFDTDGQDSESIEAFLDMHEKAHEEGQQLLALVLLGPNQAALRQKLPSEDNLIVLAKPIKMKQVQAALARLLPKV